jgi:hypothetical protein
VSSTHTAKCIPAYKANPNEIEKLNVHVLCISITWLGVLYAADIATDKEPKYIIVPAGLCGQRGTTSDYTPPNLSPSYTRAVGCLLLLWN